MNHVFDFLYFTMLWHLGAPWLGGDRPSQGWLILEIIEQCASECTFHVQTNQAQVFTTTTSFI